MPNHLSNFRRSQSGATAIEYAIIAGLIGLGLVGSLVTTRGSLSAVFGTASSKMASSIAEGSGSSSPRAGFWDAKTLSGAPATVTSGNYKQTVYNYSDGTQVALFRDTSVNPPRLWVNTLPPDRMSMQLSVFSEDGRQLDRYEATFWSPSPGFDATRLNLGNFPGDGFVGTSPVGVQGNWSAYTTSSGFTNNAPTVMQVATFNASGQMTSNYSTAATSDYIAKSAVTAQDFQYFKDIMK